MVAPIVFDPAKEQKIGWRSVASYLMRLTLAW
jgi:hypothetical protein